MVLYVSVSFIFMFIKMLVLSCFILIDRTFECFTILISEPCDTVLNSCWIKECCRRTLFTRFFLTLKRPAGASEAQAPIQNNLYTSILIISVHCFRYPSKIFFKHFPVIWRICCIKASPSDNEIKAWLKGPKWASQAQVPFSAADCLCCWQPNGTSLKDNV